MPAYLETDSLSPLRKASLGNEGGQKFWSWWGFTERQEWCACFVSWCADQAGLIQKEAVPKFSVCTDGVDLVSGKGEMAEWRKCSYPRDYHLF